MGTAQDSDRFPDLTWIQGPLRETWENTKDGLGNDHPIFELRLQVSSRLCRTTPFYHRTKLTDWPKARTDLESFGASHF